MKKTLLLLAIVALLAVPVTAMAATEFSLGGFIKLDSFWDSSQEGKNMNSAILRNNNPAFQHGRFFMTSQGSRFNFTMKGPKLWGAQVTGFIEVDFDNSTEPGNISASNAYVPRLRHAMFRLNWPQTELMMGQYWSMFCEFYPELLQDGPYQFHGVPTHRLAQVRVTQKWCDFTFAGLVGRPTDVTATGPADTTTLGLPGPNSETPQLQGKVAYEKDLWGKAAFYGVPRGFVAQVVGGWQRTRFNRSTFTGFFWDGDFWSTGFANQPAQRDNQYLNSWMVQGTLFIPVIPTYSANLAGTASLSAQWYVGEGLEAFGEARSADNSFFSFVSEGTHAGPLIRFNFDRKLMKRYGGYIQAQYYFTNQWFINASWGMDKAFGVAPFGPNFDNPIIAGTSTTAPLEPQKMWQEYDLALWYRPIQALKFGVQYSYSKTNWFGKTGPTTTAAPFGGQSVSDTGEAHRVEFVGLYFF